MTSKVILFQSCFSPSKMSSGPEKFALFLDYVKPLTHSHYSDSINMHFYKHHCILHGIFAHKHLMSDFVLIPFLCEILLESFAPMMGCER